MPTPPTSEVTGQPIDPWSEAWRWECECRYVLDHFQTKAERNICLYGDPNGVRDAVGRVEASRIKRPSIAAARGLEAAEHVREGVMRIVEARKAKAKGAA